MTNDNAGLLPDDIADIHKMIAMFHKYLPDLEKIDTNLRMAVPAAPSITTLDKDAVYESNQTAYLTAATLFRALERMAQEEMYLRSKLQARTPASPSVDAMRLALDALKSCGTEYNEYLDFKGADGMEQFYDEEKVSLAIAALSVQPVSGWLPIDTFDKDAPENWGKHVLVWCPVSRCAHTACWWVSKRDEDQTPRWHHSGVGNSSIQYFDTPTHWRLLPLPPMDEVRDAS